VVIAVALGIASTLAVSAIQKTRQIGILKALGMSDGRTGTVFMWQGVMLGALGTAGGVGLALGLIAIFQQVSAGAEEALFPIEPQLGFIAISAAVGIGIAMASAIIPSRRTARLDPIEVIQNG
jgi:lipoprotein-releasing system permease protein